MDIPSYQIHNVLRDYVRHLQRRTATSNGGQAREAEPLQPISAPEKRRLVQERVTAEIVERIVHMELEESRGAQRRRPAPDDDAAREGDRREFLFHVLTDACKLRRCRLTLGRGGRPVRRTPPPGDPQKGE